MKRVFSIKCYLGLIALFILVAAPAASAHQGDPNYRSEVTAVQPAGLGDGLSISVVNFDDHVRIEAEPGKELLVVGYEQEPLARIHADGRVEENLNSPSYYLNHDRYANVDLPEHADAEAEPDWKQVGQNGIYEWHDHRSHWMGEGLPPQVKDESVVTKVFDYTIPVEIDGHPARFVGTLTWVGSDSEVPVVPLVIATLVVFGGIGFWVLRRRRETAAEGPIAEKPARGDEKGEDGEAW